MPEAPDWVRSLAARHAAEIDHQEPCEGTLRHIGPEARRRGVRAVRRGLSMSLARPVSSGRSVRNAEVRPTFRIETHAQDLGGFVIGSDRIELDCHGMENTHLDGLTHVGLDGRWHGGMSCSEPLSGAGGPMLMGALTGVSTRVIGVDMAAWRATPWAGPDPVQGAEIEAAIRTAGLVIEAGDALMVYMGRDAFERAGNSYGPISDFPDGRPGLGRSGAEFLADTKVSVLCWDFLDAHAVAEDPLPAHALTWAIGLALIDNCDLGPAMRALAAASQSAGLLTVAPLRISGATGCVVNPILLY